jgi:hypothetical protein
MLAAMMTLMGCQSYLAMPKSELDRLYIKKEDADKNLKEVEEKYNNKIVEQEKKISGAKDVVITAQDNQIQAAANALYSVKVATDYFPKQGALDFTKYRTSEGMVALNKPPTVDEIINGPKRLLEQIRAVETNNATELERLRKEHERLMGENEKLSKEASTAKNEVNRLTEEKGKIITQKENEVAAAQKKADEADSKFTDAARKLGDVNKAIEKSRDKIMLWCGIGAALAMIGAVYSPVGKGGLALISAILGFVAIAVTFIEGWMVLLVGIIGIFAAISYFLYKHHIAEVSNDNIINAIQDVRENNNESYTALKEKLKEWNTVYKKDKDGNLVEVTDRRAEDYVNQKLAKFGRLSTKK